MAATASLYGPHPSVVSCVCKPHAVREYRSRIKGDCVHSAALAGQPGENQLRIGIHADVRVLFAYFVALFDGDTALTLLHEAMQFINLNPGDFEIFELVAPALNSGNCWELCESQNPSRKYENHFQTLFGEQFSLFKDESESQA